MLTIDECRKALGKSSKKYSDEQVLKMRDGLDNLINRLLNNYEEEQIKKNSLYSSKK